MLLYGQGGTDVDDYIFTVYNKNPGLVVLEMHTWLWLSQSNYFLYYFSVLVL